MAIGQFSNCVISFNSVINIHCGSSIKNLVSSTSWLLWNTVHIEKAVCFLLSFSLSIFRTWAGAYHSPKLSKEGLFSISIIDEFKHIHCVRPLHLSIFLVSSLATIFKVMSKGHRANLKGLFSSKRNWGCLREMIDSGSRQELPKMSLTSWASLTSCQT